MDTIYYVISFTLLIILLISYIKIRIDNYNHKSWLPLILPGIVAIVIIIFNIIPEYPIDIKLVNHSAYKIRRYCNHSEITDDMSNKTVYTDRYTLVYKDNKDKDVEIDIPRNTYKYFHYLWSKDKKYIENHSKGNKLVEEVKWNKDPSTALLYSKPERYINYMRNVLDLYDIYDIGVTTALQHGLYVRRGVGTINSKNFLEPRQDLVIGLNVPDSIERKLNYIASLDDMFRPMLLVWIDETIDKTANQRSLWEGGKENEVVFCIGLDESGKKIKWSNSFSWSETKRFENYILKNSLSPGKTLDMDDYVQKLENGYKNGYWDHINLENYKFVKLPFNQITAIHLMGIVLIVNIIVIYDLFKRRKKDNIK